MTSRWLLVEACSSPRYFPQTNVQWMLHRLYLSPEGQPSLESRQHPEEAELTVEAWESQVILARLAHRDAPSCLVVACWLVEHPEMAQTWADRLYREEYRSLLPRKHVRRCVACEEPIPTLMVGYGTGARFCERGCRQRARQAGKTISQYVYERQGVSEEATCSTFQR